MEPQSAFQFHGNWKELAPILFTNLLLTIVTLGFYRFWGTTRVRQYLWSQTQFIDDRLEWTGTGKELFIGFMMATFLIIVPLVGLQFLAQYLAVNGSAGLSSLLTVVFYFGFLYLSGFAIYRGLRYRLGRTYWRGIRGGSDDPGFSYGWAATWKTFVGGMLLGILVPWSMKELWNDRWNRMSFGPHKFESNVTMDGLLGRWLIAYAVIFASIIGVVVIMATLMATISFGDVGDVPNAAMIIPFIVAIFGVYFLIGLAFLAYYALFYRSAVRGLSLHTLDFDFKARTMDWLKLAIGDIALVIFTLGIGSIFLSYRHWKFFITHMEAYGEINVDELTQSKTERSKHGEGLMDAFDVGAI
ncbi:hypothetical protein LPB140_03770 [Sphingorhabdus lutea]|uniref:DUF898 domain-containing protein n=1 Tax=Sphingorhabdus lutea TaxID=1913578 RepID=A0A1L3JEJ0_9SPHN|nr:hypothetical protein LPB140_03770 [Sphingorhabdus lutea]